VDRLATAPPQEDAVTPTPDPVVTASGRGRVAALTLDDGPNGDTTTALLDLFAAHGVQATFCVVGAQVRAAGGAEVLRRTVAEGHPLAVHGMTYADQGAWHADRVRADLRASVAVICDALGDQRAPVPWFRAPNGSWGAAAAVAVEEGLQPLGVTGTIDDWRTQHVGTLEANLRAAIRPGGIVLAHDGGGDRWGTVQALRTVLPQWLAAGWRFTRPAHPDLDVTDGAGAWNE
jgi:endo-1,4-beta-xylanase